MPFLLFAALGLATMSGAVAFAVGSSAILVLSCLAYAHAPSWAVYYLEIQRVLAFLSAFGLWQLLTMVDDHGVSLQQPWKIGTLARGGAAMMVVSSCSCPSSLCRSQNSARSVVN